MTLADRRSAALNRLAHRPPPTDQFPGETQPSGDMPLDWPQALAWLDARDRLEDEGASS